jgi:hypothetical protein
MTEGEVVRLMREHLESQFPKTCPNCQRHYANLREYIAVTSRLEPAMCYDAEIEDWNPAEPVGTATYTNCPCGTTLALSSHGMPLLRLWALYNWARVEKKRRRMTMNELLSYLRDKIRGEVMGRGADGETPPS